MYSVHRKMDGARYKWLATVHLYKFSSFSYFLTPRYVNFIDFSVNLPKRVDEFYIKQKCDRMAPYYSLEAPNFHSHRSLIDQTTQVNKRIRVEISPEETKESEATGWCYGMSVEFISDYLKHRAKGKQPMEAIKATSPAYIDGASWRAELIQYAEHHLSDPRLTRKEGLAALENFTSETCRPPQEKVCMTLFGENDGVRNPWCEFLSLSSESIHETSDFEEGMKTPTSANARESIEALAEGVYLTTLSGDKKAGHAIVFIKTNENCFIFDPNEGTYSFPTEKAADELWKKRIAVKECDSIKAIKSKAYFRFGFEAFLHKTPLCLRLRQAEGEGHQCDAKEEHVDADEKPKRPVGCPWPT